MPPKKTPEAKETIECVLRLGKLNCVVAWNEEMKSVIGALHGGTANFLHTNVRHVHPTPQVEDYIPALPSGQTALYAPLITKLREGAFEGRRKAVTQQLTDEQKIWSIMWARMSPASQSRVVVLPLLTL